MASATESATLDAILTLTKMVCKTCNLDVEEMPKEEKETNGQENQENPSGEALDHPSYKLVSHTYKQLQSKIQDAQSQLDMANDKICGLQTLLGKTEHKQPSRGGKRGRGRPRKTSGHEPPSHRRSLERPVKVTSYAESDDSSEVIDEYIPAASPVRSPGGKKSKGRGRPRKDASEPRAKHAKKGRGRPPKNQESGGNSPSLETRHRGVSAVDYAETGSLTSEEVEIYESDDSGEREQYVPSSDSKRGRGRPRKVANPAADETDSPRVTQSPHSDSSEASDKVRKAEANSSGKKRGRPPKTPSSEPKAFQRTVLEDVEGLECGPPAEKKARGRGRPPKKTNLAIKAKISNTPGDSSTPAGDSTPAGGSGTPAGGSSTPAAGGKKGRGRPRKTPLPDVGDPGTQEEETKEEGEVLENGKDKFLPAEQNHAPEYAIQPIVIAPEDQGAIVLD